MNNKNICGPFTIGVINPPVSPCLRPDTTYAICTAK